MKKEINKIISKYQTKPNDVLNVRNSGEELFEKLEYGTVNCIELEMLPEYLYALANDKINKLLDPDDVEVLDAYNETIQQMQRDLNEVGYVSSWVNFGYLVLVAKKKEFLYTAGMDLVTKGIES